ncbi:MAG: hypothetical protein WCV62_00470 [Candidatus Peribacteraceae bacterium]
MPHHLSFTETRERVLGTLIIRKPEGEQIIDFVCPPDVTLKIIEDSWKSQRTHKSPDGNWIELTRQSIPDDNGGLFTATRMIVLGKTGLAVVWSVFHYHNAPLDQCSVLILSPEFKALVESKRMSIPV